MSSGAKGKSSSNTNGGGKAVSLPKVGNSKSPVKYSTPTAQSAKQSSKLPSIHAKSDVSKKSQDSNVTGVDANISENSIPNGANNASAATNKSTEGTISLSEPLPEVVITENRTNDAVEKIVEVNNEPVVEAESTEKSTEKLTENAENEKDTNKPEEMEPIKRDGDVRLIYEQYSELFPIVNGSTSQAAVDDVYCLSFVMPDCLVHLSIHDPPTKRQLEIEGKLMDLFLPESPVGVYQNLEADKTYYVYVEQQADQLARDQAITRQRLHTEAQILSKLEKDDGRVMESCSCIYGNPCVDEYGCRDWTNRFAIAKNNGWKGF